MRNKLLVSAWINAGQEEKLFGARARRIAPQREHGGKQPRVAILKNAFYLWSQGATISSSKLQVLGYFVPSVAAGM
ncbi:hypothetical protein [Agrobacterium vitis]|uniref:Uncharacterized protein n=1 Tax=Agrobacterium vitis TaxID=373 RepID=A0ABW9TJM4_AGRVI|nr:hypothetical protein [Agrobacterium vitis]MUO42984.1 hypothetical protein [Agrobacterium vitis]